LTGISNDTALWIERYKLISTLYHFMASTKSFMIIDDSYIDRLVAGMILKRNFNDARIYEASDGRQAIDWLVANQLSFGNRLIILLDIMMPQMNGFEFLELFENLDDVIKKKITIVMLSSTIDPEDIERARKHAQVKKLLSKPLSANELKEYV
jgi:CheY-like chemotaxis protein